MRAGVGLTKAHWDNLPHNIRDGLSPLVDVPKALELVFPGFDFGKCDPSELHDWEGNDGWVPLRKQDWPEFGKQWDANMPARYGLRIGAGEFDGFLMWGNDFLVVRESNWAREHRRVQDEYAEQRHKNIMRAGQIEKQETRHKGAQYVADPAEEKIQRDTEVINLTG